MRHIGIGLLLALALSGCRPAETQPPVDANAAPAATPTADEVPSTEGGDSECVSLVEADVVDDAYARGMAKLEESSDGEHHRSGPYEEALGALRIAADGGHRAAQSKYGRTTFEGLFLVQAPEEGERTAYETALTYIRIAALRGDSRADGYLPGLVENTVSYDEPPFDQIPEPWVKAAIERSDAWLTCHGEEAGDRGVLPTKATP